MRDGPNTAHVDACLDALKAATAAAHARIEAVSTLSALAAPAPTLQDYGRVLQRFYIHFARNEPGLFACLAPHVPAAALARRENVAALRADLLDLGLKIPPVSAQPGPQSPAEAAGWLYVHEGTSLGGLVILRGLRPHLGPALGTATRYYQRHGKATAATWRETRRLIASLLPDAAARDLALAGATQAFAEMHRIMAIALEGGAQASRGGCPFAGAAPPEHAPGARPA